MSKISELVEELKDLKKALKKAIDKAEEIEQEELVQTYGGCPAGQIRNAQGQCVDKLE